MDARIDFFENLDSGVEEWVRKRESIGAERPEMVVSVQTGSWSSPAGQILGDCEKWDLKEQRDRTQREGHL